MNNLLENIGMENSSGKWILVDTVFQNEGIFVDIFIGWILVEIFHEFSWTFIVHENSSFLVNFHGHFWGLILVDTFFSVTTLMAALVTPT